MPDYGKILGLQNSDPETEGKSCNYIVYSRGLLAISNPPFYHFKIAKAVFVDLVKKSGCDMPSFPEQALKLPMNRISKRDLNRLERKVKALSDASVPSVKPHGIVAMMADSYQVRLQPGGRESSLQRGNEVVGD